MLGGISPPGPVGQDNVTPTGRPGVRNETGQLDPHSLTARAAATTGVQPQHERLQEKPAPPPPSPSLPAPAAEDETQIGPGLKVACKAKAKAGGP